MQRPSTQFSLFRSGRCRCSKRLWSFPKLRRVIRLVRIYMSIRRFVGGDENVYKKAVPSLASRLILLSLVAILSISQSPTSTFSLDVFPNYTSFLDTPFPSSRGYKFLRRKDTSQIYLDHPSPPKKILKIYIPIGFHHSKLYQDFLLRTTTIFPAKRTKHSFSNLWNPPPNQLPYRFAKMIYIDNLSGKVLVHFQDMNENKSLSAPRNMLLCLKKGPRTWPFPKCNAEI